MKCPKCGFDNQEDALFCAECGEKLSKEKLFCPECNSENEANAKHCTKCGALLKKDTNTFKLTWIRSLQLILLGFGIGLMIAGMFFGFLHAEAIQNGKVVETKTFYPIPYLFSEMFKELKTYKDAGMDKSYVVLLIHGVFILISYIIMLLGVTIFGIVSMNNAQKNGKKENYKNGSIVGVICSIIPYILFTSYTLFSTTTLSSYLKVKYTAGYGFIVLIIGATLCLISYILNRVENNKKEANPKTNISQWLYGLGSIATLFTTIFAFGTLLNNVVSSNTNSTCTTFSRFLTEMMLIDANLEVTSGFGGALFGYILAIISVLLLQFLVPYFFYKWNKKAGVFAIISLLITTLSIVLFLTAGQVSTTSKYQPSGLFWLFIVFLATAIVSIIGGIITEEKKEAN